MASRQWSAETLHRGMSSVLSDVKTEPWVDSTDEELKERLKAGFKLLVQFNSVQLHRIKQPKSCKNILDARIFENKLLDLALWNHHLLQLRRIHLVFSETGLSFAISYANCPFEIQANCIDSSGSDVLPNFAIAGPRWSQQHRSF